jgi:hypothetical protein
LEPKGKKKKKKKNFFQWILWVDNQFKWVDRPQNGYPHK